VPEKSEKADALAKQPILTLAREGRKFGACLCLISQRPAHLSATALSQCNTNVIFRITNPYDLDRIRDSCEGIDSDMQGSITTLRVGDALIVGEAVGLPIFVKVRRLKSKLEPKGADLEEMAKKFELDAERRRQDVEAFL
jgi:DNA helicase HerA-like ATPase